MIKIVLRALAAAVVILSPCSLVSWSSARAQAPYAEDMRFVRELRSRGYSDLAREYLQKLAQKAPPELKKELPLEIALTNLEAANEEPDSAKRLTLYAQARAECEKFLKDNPGHPRTAEARLEIARATTLQGKTQLSRALLDEDLPTRVAEGLKARATLVEAFNQLKQLPSTPETELAKGLNLFDQAQTFLNTGSDKELLERGKKVQEAQKVLEKVAGGEVSDPFTWQARAWVARCIQELGEPKKARDRYLEITDTTSPAARDGRRLARYFILLVAKETKEAPNNRPVPSYIIERASDWIRDYPGLGTPESHGVRYLLAEMLLAESENAKLTKPERDAMVARARKYLSEVERTENDFTDRAKRLKIAAMDKQGLFKNSIDKLRSFEDCFVRAQYEQMQIGEDAKKYKDDPDKLKAARKQHVDLIIQALQAGLKKPDAKSPSTELNNARALLAYYLLDEGKYKEAIEVGEGFARRDPKPSQAATAAVYALLAYGQMIAERERNATDPKALQGDKQHQDDKQHMLDLAKYMEERWPKERAGDLARHQIALRLLREEKFPEAIDKLIAITPAYPSYIRTQFALAHASLQQAEQDKSNAAGYRQRAFAVLSALPDPLPGADADTNRDYVQAKVMLARELAKEKKFAEVDALMKALLPKLGTLRLVDDAAKDKELRSKFEDSLVQLSLYSTASQADADFKAARYAEVSKRLDPIVDEFNANKLPQLKESGMAAAIFGLDLKANVQRNNIERAKVAIKALQGLQSDKGAENNTTAVLSQLVGLISQQVEELRKKGDKDSLKKAQDGFTSILNEVAGVQKKPAPKLALLLAKCYSGMDEHRKAAELLKSALADKPAGDGAEAPLYHVLQLLLVQELRETKETDKAKQLLDEILGTREKPGWGAKSLDAQELRIMLMEDEGQYNQAALMCDRFITQLVRRLDDNKLKEYYFKFYYHLVYCIFKNGQTLENSEQKSKAIKDAAQRIVSLQKRQGGFGSEETRKRFEDLLEKETELREQYNALKDAK